MTESAVPAPPEVPTFSECVVGYRAWTIDAEDRLWPASDHRAPWVPGVNTARCNCRVRGALSFDWTTRDGRRVLEPHPQHEAPDVDCTCGLYSWRRPPARWKHAARLKSGKLVCGAVASWGRLMVHGDGFRAEHACVVTLAYPADTGRDAMGKLRRVADRYCVDLVALDQLEVAASRHGSPIPEWVGPEPDPARDPHSPAAQRSGRDRTGPAAPTAAQPSIEDRQPRPATRSVPLPVLEPIPTRDKVALGLILAFLLIGAPGGYMWLGRGTTAVVGLALWGGSMIGVMLTGWCLQAHDAVRRVQAHGRHRLRHRRERRHDQARAETEHMSDAEFVAIEDALEPLYRHGNDLSNSLDPYRGL